MEPNYLPPTQRHNFFRNLSPLSKKNDQLNCIILLFIYNKVANNKMVARKIDKEIYFDQPFLHHHADRVIL